MNSYTPGSRITIVDIVSDPFTRALPGQPADQDGYLLVDDPTEAITIWQPNGVIFTPSPVASRSSQGTYRFTFVIPSPPPYYPDSSLFGVWSWQTSSTGAAQGKQEKLGTFRVDPTPS